MRWLWALALLPGLVAAAPALASEEEALALGLRYHDTHNRHVLAETMALYAPDAEFQLNMGRPLVRGEAAIAGLERFDVVAGSLLYPHGWRVTRQGDAWAVHVAGVLESSRVFAALGLGIVVAVPEVPVLLVRDGRILRVNQPPLRAACMAQIGAGFAALAQWLAATGDAAAALLVADGRLLIEAERLPLLIETIVRWRAATGWAPVPAEVRACAEPVVAPR